MIDDKFIDDFIQDAEKTGSKNQYIFTFNTPAKYVKSTLGIFTPFHSKELISEIQKIRKVDRVFIHWYSPKISEILALIPTETKIYLFFWGADFLEPPSFSHTNNPINRFLYDPLTLDVIRQKNWKVLQNLQKSRIAKARASRNVKNQLATHWSNLVMQWNTITKKNYALGMQQRQAFLKRISAICHWNEYDVRLLEDMYQVKLNQNYFVYGVGIAQVTRANIASQKQILTIWLGNSDTETNNHVDFLNSIAYLKNEDIKIICPLNYGNKEYGEEVAEFGKNLFGERFHALLDFIERDTYYNLMDEVDVAVMPHNRGQAGGNIIAFLKKGIKVYMKPQSSIYKLFKSYEIPIFTIDDFLKSSLYELKTNLSEAQIEKSITIINATVGNEEKRIDALKKILLNE